MDHAMPSSRDLIEADVIAPQLDTTAAPAIYQPPHWPQPAAPMPAVNQLLTGPTQAEALHEVASAVQEGRLHPRLAVTLLQRIVPIPRHRAVVHLDLPPVVDAASLAEAQRRILAAATSGQLTMDEAAKLGSLVRGAFRAARDAARSRFALGLISHGQPDPVSALPPAQADRGSDD